MSGPRIVIARSIVESVLLLENDPGLRDFADPFSGLGGYVRSQLEQLIEGKALGTSTILQKDLARDWQANIEFGDRPAAQRAVMQKASASVQAKISQATSYARAKIGPIIQAALDNTEPLPDLLEQAARLWARAHRMVFDAGRGAVGLNKLGGLEKLTREEEEWFRGAVRDEIKYAATFLTDVYAGRVAVTRAWERFNDYIKAMRSTFESARVHVIPDNVLIYWMGPADAHRCKGCEYVQELSPFTKKTLPITPRSGHTECHCNCRHRLVLRVAADPDLVRKREKALPSVKDMLVQLESLMPHRRTHRAPKGRAGNPFIGVRVDANKAAIRPAKRPASIPPKKRK